MRWRLSGPPHTLLSTQKSSELSSNLWLFAPTNQAYDAFALGYSTVAPWGDWSTSSEHRPGSVQLTDPAVFLGSSLSPPNQETRFVGLRAVPAAVAQMHDEMANSDPEPIMPNSCQIRTRILAPVTPLIRLR